MPANVSLGGNQIAETSCGATQTPTCLFPDFPGTLSWKDAFETVKEANFDRSRKDVFHYALFGHDLGLARWRINDKSLSKIVVSGGSATITTELPVNAGGSVTVLGAPPAANLNGTYSATASGNTLTFAAPGATSGTYQNWGLAVSNGTPRSNSGVSDIGGGDLMVTLGSWDNFVGTSFLQASTFFHEMGHNLDLGHGGDISDPTNCKPNYLSSMSYLFQVRGLLDLQGVPHIDYSSAMLPTLNEADLNESPSGLGAGPLPYVPLWYAPLKTSFLDSIVGTTPAAEHCDGTPITNGAQMIRVDGTSLAATPLDWNADGTTTDAGLNQDINFDGAISQFSGFNDWLNVDLRQVGARRSQAATSADVQPGQDSGDVLGIANGDLGIANGDLGIANGDLGIANGDLGIANGDLGIANGDLGSELDVVAAKALGNAPNALAAAVVGTNIDLIWTPPNVGSVSQYQVWRATCPKNSNANTCALSPNDLPARIGFYTPGGPLCNVNFNFCDSTAKNNTLYLYFVTATVEGKQSGASNQVKESR